MAGIALERVDAGVPNITILGVVSTVALLFCEYWFWDDPIQGTTAGATRCGW